MKKLRYMFNSLKWFYVRIYNHFHRPKYWKQKSKKYGGKMLLSIKDGSDYIAEKIISGEPFMAARFGSTEINAMTEGYAVDHHLRKKVSKRYVEYMHVLSGFFPSNQENLLKFSRLMIDMLPDVDVLGIWYNRNEDYFIKEYMKQCEITPIATLNEINIDCSWTRALKGKKVVVVSPFKDTIISQYENNREKIFDNENMLPKFDLRVVKAVQTVANSVDDRFSDWFEALDYMYQEIMKEEFDVALLGCGAYGFPLASMIKRAGKQAIHVGGGLQLFFGIKGGKWDNEAAGKYYNDFWVRPSENEKPKDYKKVEGGCYW